MGLRCVCMSAEEALRSKAGTCATQARMRPSCSATKSVCAPEKEVPHSPQRSGSTVPDARKKARAAW